MFLYFTGYADNTVSFKYFAFTADFLNRRTYFHDNQTLYFFFFGFFALNVTLPLLKS